jgi:hypothetical protein
MITDRPSGSRRLIPTFKNHPKCSAQRLFKREFLRAFNGLNIRTVKDQSKIKSAKHATTDQ